MAQRVPGSLATLSHMGPPMLGPISRGRGMDLVYISTSRSTLSGTIHMTSVTRGDNGPPRLRKRSQLPSRHTAIDSMHWLFRTNIPRRRSSYYQPDISGKRNFFGMSEILGVLANPAETVRSLTESKRMLQEARQEISDSRERAQIRPKHTFSRLPGFYARSAELKALENILEGDPAFTVLFGASSVGKTALLRQVLTRENYHVLHFDLRIAGFADLASLYNSLSEQMEQYFEELAKQEGYKEFEKEAWSFKHDRLNVERRLQDAPAESGIQRVKTSDVARLMELFQSSLLKYWEFEPALPEESKKRTEPDANSDRTHVDSGESSSKQKSRFRKFLGDRNKRDKREHTTQEDQQQPADTAGNEERVRPAKKMPVIFFDEAHKLPALIQSTAAMNCLLSTFLVLTKQDRLCHVIHATSDPFYHTWLRQLNIMQHCKIITIGDCSKAETRGFFEARLLPRVPEHLRPGLSFERLYEAFGGKLVHWQDYVTDYVNADGMLEIKRSSHFLQAHALLNLHIIHSSQSQTEDTSAQSSPDAPVPNSGGFRIYSAISHPHGPLDSDGANNDTTSAPSEHLDFTAIQLLKVIARITQPGVEYLPYFMLCREFGVRAVDGMVKGRILDLRWTETVAPTERRQGQEAAEETPTRERETDVEEEPRFAYQSESRPGSVPGYMNDPLDSSATAVDEIFYNLRPPPPPPPPMSPQPGDSDEEMIAVSEREAMLETARRQRRQERQERELQSPPPNPYLNPTPVYRLGRRDSRYPPRSTYAQSQYNDPYASLMEIVGPKLVPTTPIMKYAMKAVVVEYQEDEDEGEDLGGEGAMGRESSRRRTATGTDGDSEYASLSEVEEY